MKKTKAEKGITLIALIITIIVLLILAVVTIQAVQEHGIIGYAKKAREEHEKAAEEENTALQQYADYIDQHTGEKTPGDDPGGGSQESTGNWQLNDDGTAVTSGDVTLKIGDYVAYTPDGDATYPKSKLTAEFTGSSSNSSDITRDEGLKWRVFGVDSKGCLTLISDQKTSQNVYLSNATGYNNGVYILNDICEKLYSNSTLDITARSLKIEDVEGGFSETGKANRDKYTYGGIGYGKNNSSSPYTTHKQYPILYAEEKGSGTAGTIREEGIGVSNKFYEEGQLPPEEKAKATATGNLVCTQTFYSLNKSEGNFKSDKFEEMLFPSGGYYWLASRYVSCSSSRASFGSRAVDPSILNGRTLFASDGDSFNYTYALRPAVSLGSDITVKPCDGENSTENMHTLEKAS